MSKNADEPNSLSPSPGPTPPAPGGGPAGFRPRPGQTLCGDLDMRIDRDGVWHYRGSPIGRQELVRLFSRVLKRDTAGQYWLVTPAEIGRVQVDDAPFLAVALTATGAGPERVITVRTNVGDSVTVDAEHPIRVDEDPATGEPRPYVVMAGGVEALIARPVYYQLVELGEAAPGEPGEGGDAVFGVWSKGHFFPLGTLPRGTLEHAR